MNNLNDEQLNRLYDRIEQLEKENEKLKEGKHAHWVLCEDEYDDEYKCSACGRIQFFVMKPQDEGWRYCPECGAKMKGD